MKPGKIDWLGKTSLRVVAAILIGAFGVALVMNFQLVASLVTAFLILGALGASTKVM